MIIVLYLFYLLNCDELTRSKLCTASQLNVDHKLILYATKSPFIESHLWLFL